MQRNVSKNRSKQKNKKRIGANKRIDEQTHLDAANVRRGRRVEELHQRVELICEGARGKSIPSETGEERTKRIDEQTKEQTKE